MVTAVSPVLNSVPGSQSSPLSTPAPRLAAIDILRGLAFHQPVWHTTVIADFAQRPAGYGHGLAFIYPMWLLAVAILYLPCHWFMQFRSRHRDWTWLSYL